MLLKVWTSLLFDQWSLPFIVLVIIIIVGVVLVDVIFNFSNSNNWKARVLFFWNLSLLGPGSVGNNNNKYWIVLCNLFYWSVWLLINLLTFPLVVEKLVKVSWFNQLPGKLIGCADQIGVVELELIAMVIMFIVQNPQLSALILAILDAVFLCIVWDKFNNWLSDVLFPYKISLEFYYYELYPFNSVFLNFFILALIIVIDWLINLLLFVMFLVMVL